MPRRVVVASSRAGQLRLMQSALEVAGFVVTTSHDGFECILRTEREHPDLVVVESDAPALDGIAVLAALRARPDTANLPVIVLGVGIALDEPTVQVDSENELYLGKPLRLSALVDAARSILSQRPPGDDSPSDVTVPVPQPDSAGSLR